MTTPKLALLLALLALLLCSVSVSAQALEPLPPPPAAGDTLTDLSQFESFWLDGYGDPTAQSLTGNWPLGLDARLLAKATPDECFDGIGGAYPPGPPCFSGKPKVNQAYVWGMTKTGGDIWFGTAPNVHCLVVGGMLGAGLPHQTESWVCEFGDSQLSPPLPAALGDWRPPQIYKYDTVADTLLEKTPPDARIRKTLGLRSAANLNGIVLLAGPALDVGVNVFAFRAESGSYIGSVNLPNYTNIRKWVVVDGVLYAGVAHSDKKGRILRWRGDAVDPFQFEEVGLVDSDAAELAVHDGRIFVSTWPAMGSTLSGLWMSPVVPTPGGLTAAHLNGWQKVWQVDQYEPDPVTAATYGGGALASFGGYLYWGTMHVPLAGMLAHDAVYGPPADAQDALLEALATHRSISIFRGRNFAATPEVELLYGNPLLPAYLGGQWQIVPNKMLAMPRYGMAGFNNFFNNYTWSMSVYAGQLFVGTMDWSYLFADLLMNYLGSLNMADASPQVNKLHLPPNFFGADLVRFPNVHLPAAPVSVAGVGNFTNYGVRNLLADDRLYLGMANPMNLLTNKHDLMPEGGWELLSLQAGTPPVVGWVYLDENGNGAREVTEVPGVGSVLLQLQLYSHPAEATKSHGGDGWYQFDQAMFGPYKITASIPSDYIATSPTEITFFKWPHHDEVFSFGVQRARAKVGDVIWYDTDANGLQDAGEFGLQGVTVALLADAGGAPGAVVATAQTDVDGAYLFDYVLPGKYWVQVTDVMGVVAGHTLTTGAHPYGPITAVHGGVYRDADFGYVLKPGPGKTVIADTVWQDLNDDGIRQANEPGLAGIRVCAQPLSYLRQYCAVTDAHGMYHIVAPPGTYLVSLINAPANLVATHPAETPGFYMPLVVQSGQSYLYVDFGFR